MLEVKDLGKSFGEIPVVKDLSFSVNAGDVVALVGANGAGKTTTLRCVVGVEEPDTGTVMLDGAIYDEASSQIRARVCSLLDDWAFFSDMTVREHLALYAHAHAQDPSVVDDALDILGLHSVADRLPGTLSSGQSRRFALAQALVRPWDLLVLDEPEQRLDQDGRVWLGQYLRQRAAAGCGILMASHDLELCDRAGALTLSTGNVTS